MTRHAYTVIACATLAAIAGAALPGLCIAIARRIVLGGTRRE